MLEKYSGLVEPTENEHISDEQEDPLFRSSVQRLISNGLILEPISYSPPARNGQPRLFDQYGEISMVHENPDHQTASTILNENSDSS